MSTMSTPWALHGKVWGTVKYSELGEKFEEKLLNVASKYINSNYNLPDYSHLTQDGLELILPKGESLVQDRKSVV